MRSPILDPAAHLFAGAAPHGTGQSNIRFRRKTKAAQLIRGSIHMIIRLFVLAAVILGAAATAAEAGPTPAPAGAKVYFVNLKDGDSVKSPLKVVFGLSGMGVAPAGIAKKNTGHHHLLIDRKPLGKGADGKEEFNFNLPADKNHIHFGGGQTETTLKLAPGKHTLQLVLGDKDHIPHNPPVASARITITVK
jgi:hypothetical protein